jgi:hypothetical protein
MRDVEHAGVRAHLMVLVDLRAIGDRHVPAAEIDHAGAEFAVAGVQHGLLAHLDSFWMLGCARRAGIIELQGAW